MSRTRELPNSVLPAINAIINATNVLDQRYYNVRNHSDDACFYYPQPVLGQAVLFRGKCDQNIAVVQNFDVAQVSVNYLTYKFSRNKSTAGHRPAPNIA